jgi:hypothetical protein
MMSTLSFSSSAMALVGPDARGGALGFAAFGCPDERGDLRRREDLGLCRVWKAKIRPEAELNTRWSCR